MELPNCWESFDNRPAERRITLKKQRIRSLELSNLLVNICAQPHDILFLLVVRVLFHKGRGLVSDLPSEHISVPL